MKRRKYDVVELELVKGSKGKHRNHIMVLILLCVCVLDGQERFLSRYRVRFQSVMLVVAVKLQILFRMKFITIFFKICIASCSFEFPQYSVSELLLYSVFYRIIELYEVFRR